MSGEEMFELVVHYASAPHHRTGSEHDHQTRAWFGDLLLAVGAAVVRQHEYEFMAWNADAQVEVAGRQLDPVLPLPYQGLGDVNSANVFVSELEVVGRWAAPELPNVLDAARKSGCDATVIATHGADGRLIALNRAPVPSPGPPAVLVPGDQGAVLRDGTVHVRASARHVPATSATVVADFNDRAPPDLIVATPLTGWFTCAGERATGIAVTVAIAARLAEAGCRFRVVGTTGHELQYLGLQHFLRSQATLPPVLHLGACVAAGTPTELRTLEWGAGRRLFLTPGMRILPIIKAAAAIRLDMAVDPENWLGEGRDWRRRTEHLVSILGTFPLFHTPNDSASLATSPRLLDEALAAIEAVAFALIRNSEGVSHWP